MKRVKITSDNIIQEIKNNITHGSGIDLDWSIEYIPTVRVYRCSNSYHMMNPNGFYNGWIDFTTDYKVKRTESGYKIELQEVKFDRDSDSIDWESQYNAGLEFDDSITWDKLYPEYQEDVIEWELESLLDYLYQVLEL